MRAIEDALILAGPPPFSYQAKPVLKPQDIGEGNDHGPAGVEVLSRGGQCRPRVDEMLEYIGAHDAIKTLIVQVLLDKRLRVHAFGSVDAPLGFKHVFRNYVDAHNACGLPRLDSGPQRPSRASDVEDTTGC